MARLLAVIILLVSVNLLADQPIQVGLRTGLSPDYYSEASPPKGIFPELIGAVFAPLDQQLEYQINPRRRLIHQLQAGEVHMTTLPVPIDLVGKMNWPEGLIVGKEPLLTFDVNLYKLSSNNTQIKDKSDLLNYHLGSTRHPKFMFDAMNEYFELDLQFDLFNKTESLFKALLSKRVDFALLSASELAVLLRKYPADIGVEKVYTMGVVQTYLVISEAAFGREEAIKHARFIDERILQLHQQGKIQAVAKKYNLPLRSEH
jgi:ABC-type amino acid transport substrate-binding protein